MTDSTVNSPASPDRPTITISLPSGWGRAAAAGLGAALIGWFLPVVVASVGFWLVADSPWLRNLNWQSAIDAGSAFWALSLGAPTRLGGVALSLMPLLWTLIQVFVLRVLLRSTRHFSGAAAWAAIPFFAFTSLIVALTSTDAIWWHILLGSVLVSGTAALWSSLAQSERYPARMNRLAPVWLGVRIGAVWFLILVALTSIAALISYLNHREAMAEAGAAIGATGGSGAILALLQLAYLPTALAWGFSWLLGPGFISVGGEVVTATSPAVTGFPLPLWQLLPSEAVHLPSWPWPVVALGLLFGAGAGWLLRRRSAGEVASSLGGAAGTTLLLVAGWMALSAGSLGDNQLAHVGPVPAAVVLRVLLLLVLPASLAVLAMHPLTMRGLRWVIARVRDGVQPDAATSPAVVADTVEEPESSPGKEAADGEQL